MGGHHLIVARTVGEDRSMKGAPAPAEVHEILLGQGGGPHELVAGKHCWRDTANAELGKDLP